MSKPDTEEQQKADTKATTKPEAAESRSASEEVAHQIRQVMQAAGAGSTGGTAQVWRKRVGRRALYLEQLNLEDILEDPLEVVKERHGGGEYRLALRDSEAKYIPGGSINFDIAGPPIYHEQVKDEDEDEDDRLRELERRIEERLDDARGRDTPELVRYLMEELRTLREDLRRPPPGAEQADPARMAVEMMSAIQQATSPLLTALLERKEEKRDPTKELRDMLELMQMARDSFGGGGGERGGWDAIASQLARPLGSLLERAGTGELQQNPPGPMPAPGPPPSADPPNNGGPPMSESHMPEWVQALRPLFPQILGWAAEGRDPAVCADFAAHDIPEALWPGMVADLARPEFVSELVQAVPQAAPVRDWLQRFVHRLLEWTEDVEEEGPGGEPWGSGPDERAPGDPDTRNPGHAQATHPPADPAPTGGEGHEGV